MKHDYKKVFGLVGLAILVYLIYLADPKKMLKAVISIEPKFLLMGLVFLFLAFLISADRLRYLMGQDGKRLSFMYYFKIYFIGNFYGAITPSQVGGVFMKTLYLKEQLNKKFASTIGLVVLDKVLEVVALLVLGGLGSVILFNYLSPMWFLAVVVVLLLFILAVVIMVKKSWSYNLLRLVFKFIIPEKIKEKAKMSFHSFYESLVSWPKMVFALIYALVGWVVLYTFTYFVGLSLGINVFYPYFVIVMATSSLIGLLPFSFGGLGVREGAMVFLLGVFGVVAAPALTLSVVSYLLAKFSPAILGAVLSVSLKNN